MLGNIFPHIRIGSRGKCIVRMSVAIVQSVKFLEEFKSFPTSPYRLQGRGCFLFLTSVKKCR